jgi:acetyl-CoA carboxylase carboxyl transferase subunit alpha
MSELENIVEYLPFEQDIKAIDEQIQNLRSEADESTQRNMELRQLQSRKAEMLKEIYSNLNPWQTVQVSRHPSRPILSDYLENMVSDFRELHGDRAFGDDNAIVTGLGQIGYERIMIIGQNKGKDTKDKIRCNFGCANPEGYRKALLKMRMAEKFGLPIVTLIDTPGAYPGIGAEERGQAQAIAVNLMEMSRIRTPIICIVIGEGGSGGALGIGVGDRLAMLEHSYYSVISPEGCAAILWRDGTKASEAATALGLTSKSLTELGVVDSSIKEPLGGAHRNPRDTISNVSRYITTALRQLKMQGMDTLIDNRYKKIRSIGNPRQLQA